MRQVQWLWATLWHRSSEKIQIYKNIAKYNFKLIFWAIFIVITNGPDIYILWRRMWESENMWDIVGNCGRKDHRVGCGGGGDACWALVSARKMERNTWYYTLRSGLEENQKTLNKYILDLKFYFKLGFILLIKFNRLLTDTILTSMLIQIWKVWNPIIRSLTCRMLVWSYLLNIGSRIESRTVKDISWGNESDMLSRSAMRLARSQYSAQNR